MNFYRVTTHRIEWFQPERFHSPPSSFLHDNPFFATLRSHGSFMMPQSNDTSDSMRDG